MKIPKGVLCKVRRCGDEAWMPYTTTKRTPIRNYQEIDAGAFWVVEVMGWELRIAPSVVMKRTNGLMVPTQREKAKSTPTPKMDKRRWKKTTTNCIEKANRKARAQELAMLRNPRTGVKPADPVIQTFAPGSGTDDWREQD
jgi:hypothetical protein